MTPPETAEVPPNRSAFSSTTTDFPPSAARQAATSPAAPLPTTATSTTCSITSRALQRAVGQQEINDENGDGSEHVGAGGGAAADPPGQLNQRWCRRPGDDVGDEGVRLEPLHVHGVRIVRPHAHRG